MKSRLKDSLMNLNLALKVCRVKADLLELRARFTKRKNWGCFHPKHYNEAINLTMELIDKFHKNHGGCVELNSKDGRTSITVRIKNHSLSSCVPNKEVFDKLSLMMLYCIEDERQMRIRYD